MNAAAEHRQPRLPRPLSPGETIGVATPSGIGAPIASHRFERGIGSLRAMGFRVRVGANAPAVGEVGAGTAIGRAAELNDMFRDREVRAIIATVGGLTSNSTLNMLDYAAFAADPKFVVGYSDVTAILLALTAMTNIPTYHGPTVMPELGEFPQANEYTIHSLRSALTTRHERTLTSPRTWTDEFLQWDQDDARPRKQHPARWRWNDVRAPAAGILWGGNLETISVLAGTKFYRPPQRGTILLAETTASSLAAVDRIVTQLEQTGALDRLAGIIVARPFRVPHEVDLARYFFERFAEARIPIVADVDAGHTDPMITLPLGADVILDPAAGRIKLPAARA